MKTTNPKDYIELLELFSIGLCNGLLDKSEVIKWADKIISNDLEPDYFFTELSLYGSKSNNDIISYLNEYIGQKKPIISARVFLGLLYKKYIANQLPIEKLLNALNWIIWEKNLSDDEKSFMYGLEDYYYLEKENNFIFPVPIETQTLRFLEIYKDFQIENFVDWGFINTTIDEKVKELKEIEKKENEEFVKNQNLLNKRKWWKLW